MKKGFTLVEILGVITIIGLLALLIVPIIVSLIGTNAEEAYQDQLESVKSSMASWAGQHLLDTRFNNKMTNDGRITIRLGCLKREGLVEVGIRNPQSAECFCNDATLTVIRVQNSFIHEINETELNREGCNAFTNMDTCEIPSNQIANLNCRWWE